MTVCHQKVPSWWIFKKPFIFLNFHETLQKSDTSIFSNFHDSGHKNQILPFSLIFMTPGKGKKIKNQWSLSHFENENTFRKRTTFWKWKLIPKPILKMKTIGKYVHPIMLSAQCRQKKMSFLSVPSLRLLCVFWGSFVSLWVGGCAFYEAMGANNWEVSCSNFDRKYSSVLWQAIYPKIAMIIFWSSWGLLRAL